MSRRTRLAPLLALLATMIALPAPGTQAQTFTNPLYTGGGDPYITYANGKYYMTLTTIQNEISVLSSSSLRNLAVASHVGVYNNGEFYESAKLYPYNGKWYITYTDFKSFSVNIIKVLESDTSDPQGTYHLKASLTSSNAVAYDACLLTIPAGFNSYAGMYVLYSDYGHLYIQPLSNPYTLKPGTSRTVLAVHDQAWENTAGGAIEAPNILWHNGQLTILYSIGIYNESNYSVGGLRYNGGNPTSPGSYTKLPGPLFTQSPGAGVYDAGVADPFYSPDGRQAWFAYSDYNVPDEGDNKDPNRTILAQPIYFDAANNPILMTPIPVSQPIPLPSGDPNGALLTGAAFTLTNEAGGLNLNNPGGSQQSGAPVLLGYADGLTSQSFLLDALVFGTDTLTNVAGSLALDDPNGSTVPGIKAALDTPTTSASQQFRLSRQADGTQTVTDVASGLNLDDPNGSNAAGTQIQFYTPNGATAQNWALQPSADAQGIVSSAIYTLTNVASGLNLDNANGSRSPGSTVQLYQANNSAAQNWRIEAAGDGVYTLTNIASGELRLDDPSGSQTPGTQVQLYYANTLPPQQYQLRRQPDGAYTVTNVAAGLNLDAPGGAQAGNGTRLQLQPASGESQQEWRILPAPDPNGIVSGAIYTLTNQAGGLTLSVPGGAPGIGTQLDQEPYSGSASQQWRLSLVGAVGATTYTLTNVGSRLDIDDPGGSNVSGTRLQLYTPNGQTPQEYQIQLQSDGSYTLLNVAGGLAVDDPNGSSQSGNPVQLYTPNGSGAQRWVFRLALVLSGINVASISSTGGTVTWTTTNVSSTTVNYGPTASYGSTATGAGGVLGHSVALTGLAPGTTYHYQVTSTDIFDQTVSSADQTFTTVAATITGKVSLQGVSVATPAQPLTFTLTPTGTTTGNTIIQTLTLASGASFSLANVPAGTYTLGVKGAKWLRTDVPVDTTRGDFSVPPFTLLGGDLDGNNSVDINDFTVLRSQFNTSGTGLLGDINGDGTVDINDFNILRANFNKAGDP